MDLKSVFQQLNKNMQEAGFSSQMTQEQVRQYAIENADNREPLECFIGWLDRCPEARDILERLGCGWGFKTEERAVIPFSTTSQEPSSTLAFRARIRSQGYDDVQLVEVVGHLLKVRAVLGGLITVIPLSAVSPVDVQRVVKHLDVQGKRLETYFDPDEVNASAVENG